MMRERVERDSETASHTSKTVNNQKAEPSPSTYRTSRMRGRPKEIVLELSDQGLTPSLSSLTWMFALPEPRVSVGGDCKHVVCIDVATSRCDRRWCKGAQKG